MRRDTTLEETVRELETRVSLALGRVQRLQKEQTQLQEQLDQLERRRVQILKRVNTMLDRIESLG